MYTKQRDRLQAVNNVKMFTVINFILKISIGLQKIEDYCDFTM